MDMAPSNIPQRDKLEANNLSEVLPVHPALFQVIEVIFVLVITPMLMHLKYPPGVFCEAENTLKLSLVATA